MKVFNSASVRSHLIFGIGTMLLSTICTGVVSIWLIRDSVNTFKDTENRRLEELSYLNNLQHNITQTSNFLESLDDQELSEAKNLKHIQRLEAEINWTLHQNKQISSLLPTSLRPERAQLLQSIQTSLQKAFQSSEAGLPSLESEGGGTRQQKMLMHLKDASIILHNLTYQFSDWISTDNIRQQDRQNERATRILGLIFILTTSLAIIAAKVLIKSILRPIEVLKSGLHRLGEGELDFRIHLPKPTELAQLATSMNQMAQKLEENQRQLHELAILDGLTGLYNRREFNRLLKIEFERSIREKQPVSMIMVDFDYFKSLNDTYGHASGDQALRFVSRLVQREVRPCDLVARFGGEELAIILPNTNAEEAFAAAERLRRQIANSSIPIQANQCVSITASFGCATFPVTASSLETLVTQSDQALYASKANGRDQVTSAHKSQIQNAELFNNA